MVGECHSPSPSLPLQAPPHLPKWEHMVAKGKVWASLSSQRVARHCAWGRACASGLLGSSLSVLSGHGSQEALGVSGAHLLSLGGNPGILGGSRTFWRVGRGAGQPYPVPSLPVASAASPAGSCLAHLTGTGPPPAKWVLLLPAHSTPLAPPPWVLGPAAPLPQAPPTHAHCGALSVYWGAPQVWAGLGSVQGSKCSEHPPCTRPGPGARGRECMGFPGLPGQTPQTRWLSNTSVCLQVQRLEVQDSGVSELAPPEAVKENSPRALQLPGAAGDLGVPALAAHLWLHRHMVFSWCACLPLDFTS